LNHATFRIKINKLHINGGIIIMKKEMETKLIDFEGGQLLGVKTEDGTISLCVTKACEEIGLNKNQADNEVKKIKSNELFIRHNSFNYLSVKFDGQVREYLFLEERDVPMWLAQINITPKMKETNSLASERLLNYQDKASNVLHNAFMATEEQKEEFYNNLGLEGQIIELKETLNTTINRLDTIIDNSTINSRQAQKLLHHAKDRVNTMLGGAHSDKYKKESRTYFKNLWLQLGERFGVSTYKDLNPLNYNDATTFISNWSMM
jgi:hypothetical protein